MSVVAVRNVPRWMLWLPGDPLRYEKWPGPFIAVMVCGELLHQAVLRPVRLAVVAVAAYSTWAVSPWLGLAILVLTTGWDRLARSRSWAASGRLARSYRQCQVRGTLRKRWPKLMRDGDVVDAHHKPPPHGPIWRTDTGVKLKVKHGRVAVTADEVKSSCTKLAGLVGNVHSIRLRPVNPDYSWMYVNLVNPLAGTISAASMPVSPFPRATLGRASEGHWYQPTLLGLHILIIAESGGGKSSLMWDIIRSAEQWEMPPVWYVVDKPGGIEMPALDPALGGIATEYERDMRLADKLFQKMAAEAERRNEIMRRNHWKTWKPERAEALGPLVFGIVDELLALPKKATREDGHLRHLLQMGRASGVQLIANTQLPQRDEQALGRLPDLFTGKFVGAMEGVGAAVSAIGQAAYDDAPAHTLHLPTDAGIFFAKEEGVSGFTKFKAGFVDDDHEEHLPIARGELRANSARLGRELTRQLSFRRAA
jgi:hypothetical protein